MKLWQYASLCMRHENPLDGGRTKQPSALSSRVEAKASALSASALSKLLRTEQKTWSLSASRIWIMSASSCSLPWLNQGFLERVWEFVIGAYSLFA